MPLQTDENAVEPLPGQSSSRPRHARTLGSMNGELAQLIAIAAHGSAWLAGRTGDAPGLDGANSTFQYVREVRFELERSLLRNPVVQADVAGWLGEVRRRGVTRLWLVVPGGSEQTWFVVATANDRPTEVWRPSWTVGDADDPDRRIWDVTYRGRRNTEIAPAHVNHAAALDRLTAAIQDAQTFASAEGMDEWAAIFGAALKLADATDPIPPYHPDMFPPTAFGRSARRLLATATRAFVFGGMGSWNDMTFESAEANRAYVRVSGGLYGAVLEGFVAAVNGPLDR
jgi:hypothetical protein